MSERDVCRYSQCMKFSLFRFSLIFIVTVLMIWAFVPADFILEPAYAEEEIILKISDKAIDGFLFHIDDNIKSKVLKMSGEIEEEIRLPFLFGVSLGDFTDTWNEARSDGRVHQGTDILAPLGELVVSPTVAVVTKIGYDNKGGNFVLTANPGGEQFYYAHLDSVSENLAEGDELQAGDLIGYVGNTGNARGVSPHLHIEILYEGIASNPFARLTLEFSEEEKVEALKKILASNDNDIILGVTNGGVRFLQRFLINANSGAYTKSLAEVGATGYFGTLTQKALAEYQETAGIEAQGYFGPITESLILASLIINNENGGLAVEAKTETVLNTEHLSLQDAELVQMNKDIELGSIGEEVNQLQLFLINADMGPKAKLLAKVGITGYFGQLTDDALNEYQKGLGVDLSS